MTTNLGPWPGNLYPPVRAHATANITPFTYYDGLSFLEVLEALRAWLRETLIPGLDGIIEIVDGMIQAALECVEIDLEVMRQELNDALASIELTDTELRAYVDDVLQQVINNSIELQDAVVLGLVSDETSDSRGKLNDLFVTRDELGVSAGDPRFGGLVSDGVIATREGTDNAPAILAAIAYAKQTGRKSVYIPPGTYSVRDTISVPTRMRIYGDSTGATVLLCPIPGIAVIANEGWLESTGTNAVGSSTVVENLRIFPEAYDTGSHGVVMFCYYSRVEGVTVSQAGGDGIRITDTRQDGGAHTGTLVENKIFNVFTDQCRGTGIHLVSDSSSRVTDGYIINAIVRGVGNITTPFLIPGSPNGIYMPASAGWTIKEVHTYGAFSESAVTIGRAYSTIVDGLYIEHGYGVSGLRVPLFQRGGSFDNITIVVDSDATGPVFNALKDRSFAPTGGPLVGTMVIIGDYSGIGVSWDTARAPLTIAALSFVGADNMTKLGGFGAEAIITNLDMKVSGRLRDSVTSRTLNYNGSNLALGSGGSVGGSGVKTVSVKVPPMGNGTGQVGVVAIQTTKYYTTTVRASYMGVLSLGRSTSGVVTSSITATGTPQGFTAVPTVSVIDSPTSTDSGTVELSFEFSASDGYGALSYTAGVL